MRRLYASLAVLAASSSLLAAGCGEDKQETFKKDFKPVNQQILDLGEDVGSAVQNAAGKSSGQIERQFGSLAEKTGEVQQDVNELDPPEDLKADHEDLTQAMGDAQNALEGIEKAADENNANAARTATEKLVTSSRELRDARRKLAKATGSKVGD